MVQRESTTEDYRTRTQQAVTIVTPSPGLQFRLCNISQLQLFTLFPSPILHRHTTKTNDHCTPLHAPLSCRLVPSQAATSSNINRAVTEQCIANTLQAAFIVEPRKPTPGKSPLTHDLNCTALRPDTVTVEAYYLPLGHLKLLPL